jgi:hypothetical protein
VSEGHAGPFPAFWKCTASHGTQFEHWGEERERSSGMYIGGGLLVLILIIILLVILF